MKFKRSVCGYNRTQVDQLVAENIAVNNEALAEEERLLDLLIKEGQHLDEEYKRLSRLFNQVQNRIAPIDDSAFSEGNNRNILSSKALQALIIDDDKTILAILRAILERQGVYVTEASDGAMASMMIDSIDPPDIVILDIMLPYTNGLQLLRKIRHLEKWKSIPVIMLTANSSEQEIVRLLEAGANDYIIKPFNTRELVTRVKQLINNRNSLVR